MKLLFDFLPIILFFVTFKYAEANKVWAAAFATQHFGGLVLGGVFFTFLGVMAALKQFGVIGG